MIHKYYPVTLCKLFLSHHLQYEGEDNPDIASLTNSDVLRPIPVSFAWQSPTEWTTRGKPHHLPLPVSHITCRFMAELSFLRCASSFRMFGVGYIVKYKERYTVVWAQKDTKIDVPVVTSNLDVTWHYNYPAILQRSIVLQNVWWPWLLSHSQLHDLIFLFYNALKDGRHVLRYAILTSQTPLFWGSNIPLTTGFTVSASYCVFLYKLLWRGISTNIDYPQL